MKIWLFNQYAIPPTQAGLTRHYSIAKELIRRGHEVTVIASSFDHVTRREIRLAPGEIWRREVVEGVPFLWLRTPPYPGNNLSRVWNMMVFSARVFRGTGTRQISRPDIIIGSSPHLPGAYAAKKVARRFRVPFVLEVRDLWPQSLVDLGGVSERHPMVRVLAHMEKSLYRGADGIVSVLPNASEYIAAKGGRKDRIVWIPNFIDLRNAPDPEQPAEKPVFTVTYAGAHSLANGVDLLLDAATRLRRDGWGEKVVFRLIGDGPDKPKLREKAEALGLDNVIFEDPVPKTRIYEKLQKADAFLCVTRNTPLHMWGVSLNKLFDYLVSARPIIYSINTPYNPIDQAGAGVTVPPGDAAGLAEAILALMRMSPGERHEMGLRGRAYAETHHNLTMIGERYESVLNGILDGREWLGHAAPEPIG